MSLTDQDKQLLSDIVGALSTAIAQVCRSLEQQPKGEISRRPISVAIQEAAGRLPANLENGQAIKTILTNISAELDGRPTTPVRFL